jgi:hypothetical protein
MMGVNIATMGTGGGAKEKVGATIGEMGESKLAQSSAESLPRYLNHYASDATANLIERSGQIGLPGRDIFLTNNGSLRPLQAQTEIAHFPEVIQQRQSSELIRRF